MTTPTDATLRGRLAAHESWANTRDKAARTAPARKAAEDRFVTLARERYGELPEAELAQRAHHLRQSHFARMALNSAKARRARARRDEERQVDTEATP